MALKGGVLLLPQQINWISSRFLTVQVHNVRVCDFRYSNRLWRSRCFLNVQHRTLLICTAFSPLSGSGLIVKRFRHICCQNRTRLLFQQFRACEANLLETLHYVRSVRRPFVEDFHLHCSNHLNADLPTTLPFLSMRERIAWCYRFTCRCALRRATESFYPSERQGGRLYRKPSD